MHVFTYGTLIFPEVWEAVVGKPFATIAGRVGGFSIYRVRGAVFPGITPTAVQDSVSGLVYLDVDDESIVRLDRFEDDFYRRETVAVACDHGRKLDAEAYVVPEEQRDVLTDGLVLTIEPLISEHRTGAVQGADGWTLRTRNGCMAAHYEHTLIITKAAPVIVTL